MLILSHLDDFAQEHVAEKAEDNWEKMANAFEYNHASEPVHLWAFHQVTVGTWVVPKLYSNGCTCSMVTKKLNSICPSKLMIQWCSSLGYLRYNSNFWWTSYYGHSISDAQLLIMADLWSLMQLKQSIFSWNVLIGLLLCQFYVNLILFMNFLLGFFWQLFCTDRYLVNLCITYITVSSCKETYNTLMQVLML